MKLLDNIVEKPFMSLIEHRPWGHYGLYADNVQCTAKILYIKKGESLSLQQHFLRDQEYILLDDGFTIEYSDIEVPDSLINEPNEDWKIICFKKFLEEHLVTTVGNEGDIFGFKRKIIHRASYNGDRKFGRALDLAMGTNDEKDIYRIKDQYGREDIKL
jgi:hypothetical protein